MISVKSLKSKIIIPNKTLIGQILPKMTDYQNEKYRYKKSGGYYETKTKFRVEDLNFWVKTLHHDENNKDGGIHQWISNILVKKTNGNHYVENLIISEDYYQSDIRYVNYRMEIDYENEIRIINNSSVFNYDYLKKDFYGKIGTEFDYYFSQIERV